MTPEEEFKHIKQAATEAKSDWDKAKGALDEKFKTLKSEFEVETVAAGKELYAKILADRDKKREAKDEALEEIKRVWGDRLGI